MSVPRKVLLGLGVIAAWVVPSVAFGALGYWLWGDSGMMLALTPLGLCLLGLIAYFVGDAWDDPVYSGRLASEEEIRAVEKELADIECDGSPYCGAPVHIEGCFAEKVLR
jgi:hypothetical protein